MLFQTFQTSLVVNQTKYGQINVVNLQLINETMITKNDCKKSWLIKFFLKGIYNERNFIVDIRSNRSLKRQFYKHMTPISGKL